MRSLRSNKKTRKEKKKFKKKIFIYIILLIVISATWLWVLNHDFFKPKTINISGEKTLLKKDIISSAETYLDEKFLWLLPKSNIIFINTTSIEKRIRKDFPRVYSARVTIEEGSDIFIEIEEREPHSLWCHDFEYEEVFDEECFFADQRGFLYTHAPYFSEGVFEKIYAQSDLLYIGAELADKKDFEEFFKFTSYLNSEYGIEISKIFLDYDGEIALYLESFNDVVFDKNPYIIYKYSDGYEIVKRNLHLMTQNKEFKKDFKNNSQDLRYIDLRIADQIRYKFATEEELLKEKEEQEKQELIEIEQEKDEETTEEN